MHKNSFDGIWKLKRILKDIDAIFEGLLSSYIKVIENRFQILEFAHELSRKMYSVWCVFENGIYYS